MDGLERLLQFLKKIKSRGITPTLSQQRDDAIMVSFALVGQRVEVEFFKEHFEYSYFSGNEDVHTDMTQLQRLIDENWD